MAVPINTGRGTNLLSTAAPERREAGSLLLTLMMARSDGIENVAFCCRISNELLSGDSDIEALLGRLAPWIERDFEMTRENALKSIRSERRMMEITFDAGNRGPF